VVSTDGTAVVSVVASTVGMVVVAISCTFLLATVGMAVTSSVGMLISATTTTAAVGAVGPAVVGAG
jgi:hypothetical protein